MNKPLLTKVSKPTGRALDYLVAEHVFGWTDLVWHDPGHPAFDLHGNPPGGRKVIQHVPDYSTDMDFAMDVAKELGRQGHTMHLEWKGFDREYAHSAEVQFSKGFTTGYAVSTSAANAICLAAVEAAQASGSSEVPGAGPEIDALIAEHVFGAFVKDGKASIDPDSEDTWIDLPPYSTETIEAMVVTQRMWAKGYEFAVNRTNMWDGNYTASFQNMDGGSWTTAFAETMPYAICRAALQILQEEKKI